MAEPASPGDDIAEIWKGDLFARREEAQLLQGYIESVYSRPNARGDVSAFTIAIDAGYGEGKTFFLERLSKQLALSHPVAFVDAWADDLADEPLTALAATLQVALDSWISKPGTARNKWNSFVTKTGKVAAIAAKGAFKRGIDFAIGAGASGAIEGVLEGAREDAKEAVTQAIDEAVTEIVDEGSTAITTTPPGDLMRERIKQFHDGKAAIAQMKASLSAIVKSLDHGDIRPPIVIVIDELDRCRPSYAIKLFEEIKHLFDVHGLVFVLGMNGEQLAHSVSGAYGPKFDGSAYLRRFINRRYSLEEPDLFPLVTSLIQHLPRIGDRLYVPPINADAVWSRGGSDQINVITRYMRAYDLPPRAAFELADILETCLFLTAPARLHLAYLLPLIIGHLKGLPTGTLPEARGTLGFSYRTSSLNRASSAILDPAQLATRFHDLATRPRREILRSYQNLDDPDYADMAVMESIDNVPSTALSAVPNYARLVQKVGRFRDPQLDAAEAKNA